MKNIYPLIFIALTVFSSSCSKDFLKKYEDRIVGTWSITKVKRTSIGGSSSRLPFQNGSFTFNEDGSLQYKNSGNKIYTGTWKIVKKYEDDKTLHSLQIAVADFSNQEIISGYYDDIDFKKSSRFVANTSVGYGNFRTDFEKQ